MVKGLVTLSKTFYESYPELRNEIVKSGIELKEMISDEPIPKEEIIKNIKDVEIYIIGVEKIDKEIIDSAEKLRLITKHGAGLDNLDLKYLTEKGIPVTYTPGQNAVSVADFVFALLLSIARKVPQSNATLKKQGWQLLMGTELDGKTIGIVGLGQIGTNVAKRALGFGMDVLAYDIIIDEQKSIDYNLKYVDLDYLLKMSDFVSINTALTEETYHLFTEEKFNIMKNSAYLINTSRGEITVEKDLINALKKGLIKGAALDVFDTEPPNYELVSLENVIATSHIGGSTFECAKRLGDITIDNIRRFIKGEELRFLSNPDYISYKK